MFKDNDWYGNRYILSKYCNTKNKPIFGSLQHGLIQPTHYDAVNLTNKKIGQRRFEIIPWLVWNDLILKYSKKNNIKNVIPIGAPIIYLSSLLKKKKYSKPKGVLVIPNRSAPEIKHFIDFKKLIKFLEKKKFKKPFKILVGFRDMKIIKKKNITFKGCKFITCGKREDKFYTYRLFKYFKEARNTAIFYPGTPVLYGLFFNKKTFYFNKRFLIKNSIRSIYKHTNYKTKVLNKNFNSDKDLREIKVKLNEIKEDDKLASISFNKEFGLDLKNLNSKKNIKKASLALGVNNMKSPKELKKILGWQNLFKIFLSRLIKILIDKRYQDIKIDK